MAERVSKILGRDQSLMRGLYLLLALLFLGTLEVCANEATRRAQEELRKRNLYFGDINGQTNPELVEALKRYQTRKGFEDTGALDEETANSLKIQLAATKETEPLPDVPVLKSDTARELAASDRAALQPELQQEPTSSPTPLALATETPAQADAGLSVRITNFVQEYLRDGETDDVERQVRYYAFPIQYFDHGKASREFVVKDTRNYVTRWPQRKYTLLGPVKFLSTKKPGEFAVEFSLDFKVESGPRKAHGKTRNLWRIQSTGENFKILAINEQRLHD